MSRLTLHKNYCDKSSKISDWYCSRLKEYAFPIYSSYDIRDAGFKVTNVDANIYPAGFNNICPIDKESSVEIWRNYLVTHYGTTLKKIVLVTEEHTQNPYYWDNIYSIKNSLELAGFEIKVAFPSKLESPLLLKSAIGHEVEVLSGSHDEPWLKEFKPDLIISNNDFSIDLKEWADAVSAPINPPKELGWYRRKKSTYFKFYNQLVGEFSEILGIDPFLLNIQTEAFNDFVLSDDKKMLDLSQKVDQFIARLATDYEKRNISSKPFAFVKNNAGTYGLAVIKVMSGAEVLEWTYKSRKKMKAAKGGRDVESVIIQEGIPSVVQSDGASAEPVIYMIGSDLAGGFLRTHSERSNTESLNTPGAVYKRLCVSDLSVSLEQAHLENVYGWSARLGLMAIALEAKDMGVEFKNFIKSK